MNKAKKPMPSFRSDDEAEKFIDTADLTEYDLSGFKPMRFEFTKKEAVFTIRIPTGLFEAVKTKAAAVGLPYSRYVRMLLETDVSHSS